METTYLFKENTPDGSKKLRIGTRIEYEEAIRANKAQPEEKRRYFIREKSLDPENPDLLIIEVDREMYGQWHRENNARCRNLKAAQEVKIVSLTAVERGISHNRTYEKTLCKEDHLYDEVCAKMLFEALCQELSRWRPWAIDMLHTYLDRGADICATEFSKRYGVSKTTSWRYVRQFEQRIKNFLEG